MSSFSVILAAAGSSSRFNHPADKKPFIPLNGKAVWLHSADLFLNRPDVKQVIIVIAPEDKEEFMARFGPNLAVLGIDVVRGGEQRSDSVQNALAKVEDQCPWVAIHDAARPCLDADLVETVFTAGKKQGAAIPAVPVHSTIKASKDGQTIDQTKDRSGLYLAQTPQVFNVEVLRKAFENRGESQPTDEAQLLEQQGIPVALVKGSPFNIKITQRLDLAMARACMEAMPKPKLDSPIHPFKDDNLFR